MTYPEAVKELYFSPFGSNPTNFHAQLYFLIGEADSFNRERLRLGFPTEIQVWEAWQSSPNEAEFFAAHGLKAPP